MRRALCLLMLLPSLSFAGRLVTSAPVSFDFSGVSLVAFGQATFKNILHRDFVIDPEVVALERRITISVANVPGADVPAFVERLLDRQGILTTLTDGVYYLTAKKPAVSAFDVAPLASSVVGPLPAKRLASFDPMDTVGGEPLQSGRSGAVRRHGDESEIFVPQNRPRDFIASVLVGAFGSSSVIVAGQQIVLTGSPVQLVQMRSLAAALDVSSRVVDVSASWVEVAQNSSSNRGVSLLVNVLGAKLGASVGSVSGSAVSLRNANFQLVLDAINNDGRFKQISTSRLSGDEDEKISLVVGDETPTISTSGKDTAGNPVQSILYRPSGVILDVLPHVLGNGRINLTVDGQISSFKATSTGVTGSPTLIKRQLKTRLTAGDGEVLLIGGLNDAQETASSSGLAFLPASWAAKTDAKVRTDLVLILSAKVVAN